MLKLFSTFYFTVAFLLFVHVVIWPEVKPWRRWAGILLDLIILPTGMVVGGAVVAWLWLMFLWVPLAMGLRYGAHYLAIGAVLSVAGSAAVVAGSPYWQAQLEFSILLCLVLIIMLACMYMLLRKLNEALQRAPKITRITKRFVATMGWGARSLTVIVALIGLGFAVIMAVSPYWRAQLAPMVGPLLATELGVVLLAYVAMLLLKRIEVAQHAVRMHHIVEKGHSAAGPLDEADGPRPPETPEKALLFFLPRENIVAVSGDIEADYKWLYHRRGKSYADGWYWKETIRTILGRRFARWIVIYGLFERVMNWLSHWRNE